MREVHTCALQHHAGTDRAIWRWLAAFGPDEAYHVENHDKRSRNSRIAFFGDGCCGKRRGFRGGGGGGAGAVAAVVVDILAAEVAAVLTSAVAVAAAAAVAPILAVGVAEFTLAA